MTDRPLHTLSKSAGVPVFPPHTDPAGDCVYARLVADQPWRATMEWPDGFAAGIAHRLDVSTSGAVAVTADTEELEALRGAFTAGHLVKTYLLWAKREVPWDRHVCDRPLGHDRRHKGRMVVQRSPRTPHRGRWLAAHTAFERVAGRLWRATIHTGVTHQIRVHAAFLGIPILGDRRYGGGPTPEGAPPGLAFHLHHLGFEGGGWHTEPVPAPSWLEAAQGSVTPPGPDR